MKAMRSSVKKTGRKSLLEGSSKPRGRRSGSIKKQHFINEDMTLTNYIKAVMNGMKSYDEMAACSSPLHEPISLSVDNGSIIPSLLLPGLELSILQNNQTTHSDSTIKCSALSPFYSSSTLESENISYEPSLKKNTSLALNSLPSEVTLPDPVVKGCFLEFIDNLDYGPSVSPLTSYNDDQNQKAVVICDLVSGFLTTDNSFISSSDIWSHNYNSNCHVPSYLVSSLRNPLGSYMEHEMHQAGCCSFKGSGLLEEMICGYI